MSSAHKQGRFQPTILANKTCHGPTICANETRIMSNSPQTAVWAHIVDQCRKRASSKPLRPASPRTQRAHGGWIPRRVQRHRGVVASRLSQKRSVGWPCAMLATRGMTEVQGHDCPICMPKWDSPLGRLAPNVVSRSCLWAVGPECGSVGQ